MANLPYNVATPILSNLLVHPELCPSLMVVTIQLELAERMRAAPKTEAYGALSVLVQALADCSIGADPAAERLLAPPQGRVGRSSRSCPTPPGGPPSPTCPGSITSSARSSSTAARTSAASSTASGRDRWTKPEVDAMLDGLGLTGLVRAEAMNVEEFLALADALRARFQDRDVPEPESSEVEGSASREAPEGMG